MNRLPLRRGLLLGLVGLTALALLSAGLVSTFALRAYLVHRTDDQLRSAAAVVTSRAGLLTGQPGGAVRAAVAPSDYLVEIRHPDGTLTRISAAPPPAVPLVDQVTAPTTDGVSVPVDVGGQWRAVTVRADAAVVLIALPLTPVRQTVRRLVLVELAAGAAALSLLAVLARLLVVRGLRPLDRITATAAAIADGELGRQVSLHGVRAGVPRTEADRLTLAVHGMLARLQAAIAARTRSEQRLRDFAADASHELRTPLTSIRGYLQILRHDMIEPERRAEVLARSEDEAVRMGRILDDLFYLARLDAEPRLRRDRVDLAVLARDCLADLLAVQPGRPATLRAPTPAPVTGDEHALRQVLTNLLANVRAHTPPGAAVTVEVTVVADRVRVRVTDAGPGFPAALAARAFDRFTQGEPGRGGGSGLGLAIVAGIVAAHGGEVGLTAAPEGAPVAAPDGGPVAAPDDNAAVAPDGGPAAVSGGGATVWFTLPASG
ncbi:HAMP domain-containing sensor histidine kinase [Micromonospora sp. WMMD882]|uniref:sensor histidine kinase n=1 Tax=Micromonospora sp. WMMD882 TaxID=3015151 RepID=UPI00248BC2BD|nr:HAMP domain-containing sensor histidine kinase [Micromonospora sp. WMMD882]WBB81224.1 HAMP domain-containing sensor histidine kinase [Micromonospora sp. WMMD882]